MTTTPKALPDLIVRLSDEADLCRNEGADDIARLLDEAVQALNALKPADSLASAGGVEVVAYLVSGGRIFKDQAVIHEDSALTRIAERKDGSVAEPLVRQSAHLAALSKEREVADGLRAQLDEARRMQMEALEAVRSVMEDAYNRRTAVCCGQAQGECCGNFMETWAADDLSIMDKLSPIEKALSKALTAHRKSRGGK